MGVSSRVHQVTPSLSLTLSTHQLRGPRHIFHVHRQQQIRLVRGGVERGGVLEKPRKAKHLPKVWHSSKRHVKRHAAKWQRARRGVIHTRPPYFREPKIART